MLHLKENQFLMNQYFLIWIEMILNNCSRTIMPNVENAYHENMRNIRQHWSPALGESTRNELKNKLQNLEDGMDRASFGIEHIFREFGQLFEATEHYIMATHCTMLTDQQAHILKLPHIVANLMLQGMPFELMDGDTAFVPLTWVKAVFTEIEKIIGDKKLFIISVVGIQSSGKSTLLNTMFGLKFAVSAGRCTKGLYCIMIPVDKQTMEVDYDYLLVIDTEGLRAPELEGVSQIHDNELATLVIGLSDVTIVNIKGENSVEVNDILTIVVHAMIRMHLVKPNMSKPSCIFVHQNVPAADAEAKLKISQEKHLLKLDKITALAAEEEKVAHIQHFKDVINYDEHSYAYYMPDLWQGQPPMATINKFYCEKAKQIKDCLTSKTFSSTIPLTVNKFIIRIGDLWDAILNENFVFSFKNHEEINAFSHLDRMFTQLCWKLKDVSLQLQIRCQNVVQSAEDEDRLKQQEICLENKIDSDLHDKCKSLQTDLRQFFDGNEDRHILEQWRGRYTINLNNLCQDERNRITGLLNENVRKRVAQLNTTKAATLHCKHKITVTAMQAATELREKSKQLNENRLQENFNREWPEWIKEFGTTYDESESVNNVVSSFSAELARCFQAHGALLVNQLKVDSLVEYVRYQFSSFEPVINTNDLHYYSCKGWDVVNYITDFKSKCLAPAKVLCDEVIKEVKVYTIGCHGTDFFSAQATKVVEKLKNFFSVCDDKKKENGFRFQHEFQIRFTVQVCKCAINEFIKNKNDFEHSNNPFTKLCDTKSEFFELFKLTYQNLAQENLAAFRFTSEIQKRIQSQVKNNLGILIKNAVEVKESSCLHSKERFWKALLADIAKTEKFRQFVEYQENREQHYTMQVEYFIESILTEIVDIDTGKNNLEKIIEKETEKYVNILKKTLGRVLQSSPFNGTEEFLQKVGNLFVSSTNSEMGENVTSEPQEDVQEISYILDILNSLQLIETTDFERFTTLVIDSLQDMGNKIVVDIQNSNKQTETPVENVSSLTNSLDLSGFMTSSRIPEISYPRRNSLPDVIHDERINSHTKENKSRLLLSHVRFAEGTDPVELITKRVLGCPARCPFCDVPCKYSDEKHEGKHVAFQHCPLGVRGITMEDSNSLCFYNCNQAVATDMQFNPSKITEIRDRSSWSYWKIFINSLFYRTRNESFVSYKEYQKNFPDWEIKPDRQHESANFWKWFLRKFKSDLIKHYKLNYLLIPDGWEKISWEDAEKSLIEKEE